MFDSEVHSVSTRVAAAAQAVWHRERFAALADAEQRLDELESRAADMRLVVTRGGSFAVVWR